MITFQIFTNQGRSSFDSLVYTATSRAAPQPQPIPSLSIPPPPPHATLDPSHTHTQLPLSPVLWYSRLSLTHLAIYKHSLIISITSARPTRAGSTLRDRKCSPTFVNLTQERVIKEAFVTDTASRLYILVYICVGQRFPVEYCAVFFLFFGIITHR